MQGIVLNTEEECKELISDIDSKFSFLYEEEAETYTHYIKHLTEDNNYVVIIDKDKIVFLASKYSVLFNSLKYGLKDVEEFNKEEYFNQEI